MKYIQHWSTNLQQSYTVGCILLHFMQKRIKENTKGIKEKAKRMKERAKRMKEKAKKTDQRKDKEKKI